MRISNDTIIEGEQDLSSDWRSDAIPIHFLNDYSIQLKFVGATAGSFYLECSNNDDLSDDMIWSEIEGSNQSITEEGDHTWAVREAGYKWVRVRWSHTAGNGILIFARFNAKGV